MTFQEMRKLRIVVSSGKQLASIRLANRRMDPVSYNALCLVSSNTWDVIGARAVGLMTIWVRRDPKTVFEDWGIQPSAVILDLSELAGVIRRLA